MHFATTSEILASLSDQMETDTQQAANLFELLVYQPDPDDMDQGMGEFD